MWCVNVGDREARVYKGKGGVVSLSFSAFFGAGKGRGSESLSLQNFS